MSLTSAERTIKDYILLHLLSPNTISAQELSEQIDLY